MSLQKYASPLRIERVASRRWLLYSSTGHAVSIIGLFLLEFNQLGFNVAIKVLLSACVLISYIFSLVSSGWLQDRFSDLIQPYIRAVYPVYYSKLEWLEDGTWLLYAKDKRAHELILRPNCLVTPFIVVLRLDFLQRDDQYRYIPFKPRPNIVLFADSCDAETFRRLRIRLWWQENSAAETVSSDG